MTRPNFSSWQALARRSSQRGLAALALAVLACKPGGAATGGDDPALAAIHSRMPPLPRAELGATPGFLAGGAVYLALRPAPVQRWLQALPLGPELARDLARAGNELGFDPRVDDLVARLGLDPELVISATLFRPLTTHAPAVRELLQRGTSLAPDPFPGLTPSDIAPGPFNPPRPIPPPQPIAQPDPIPPPIYRPPPPATLAGPDPAQDQLARKAGTLGTHHRIHLPMRDVSPMLATLRRLEGGRRPAPELLRLCAELGPAALCTGTSSDLLLVRSADKAVAIDFFNFSARTGSAADAERIPVIKEALEAPLAALAPLSSLRGDVAAYVDADSFTALHEVDSLADAASALRWNASGVQDHLAASAGLAALRETRRLFAGARLELALAGDTLQSTFQWEPRDDAAREVLTRLFTRKPAAASVPTLDGLCAGSLACMRSAGLPSPANFEELAVGLYARPEGELSRVLDRAGAFGGLVMFFETWPNLLGAAQRWPREAGGRIENVMIGQALEAIGRIEGIGGSLRSLHIKRRSVSGDFVGYLRLQGQDLALIRSLMSLGGVRLAPLTLPQVAGKLESAALPETEVPASLLLLTDPGTVRAGERDIEAGWAIVADSNDRLTWMLGLDRSAAVMPAFYLELPDLWQLIAVADDGPRELNFAQAWLAGRSLRLAGDIIDGRLRVDLQLAR